jgi:hypothetical protein
MTSAPREVDSTLLNAVAVGDTTCTLAANGGANVGNGRIYGVDSDQDFAAYEQVTVQSKVGDVLTLAAPGFAKPHLAGRAFTKGAIVDAALDAVLSARAPSRRWW